MRRVMGCPPLPPPEDIRFTGSVDYEVKRFVSRNNRVLGGLLITTRNYPTVTSAANTSCSGRFGHLGAPCAESELNVEAHGSEAVFNIMSRCVRHISVTEPASVDR